MTPKPRLSHPWPRLAVRDGKLRHGKAPAAESAYLDTPEVNLTAKKEAKAAPDGVRTAFAFQLDHAPDSMWVTLFKSNLDDLPPDVMRSELKVEVDGDELTIFCLPAHLERIYAFVKSAVAMTNADYQEEKAGVMRRVAEEGHTDATEAVAEKNQIESARQQFERLDL